MADPIDAVDKSLSWTASINEAKEIEVDKIIKEKFPSAIAIRVGGILADQTKCENNWSLEDLAVDDVVNDINAGGVTFRIDHGAGTRDVAGMMTKASKVGASGGQMIPYEAEVMTADPSVAIPILKGWVKAVSMRANPLGIKCSVCASEGMKCKCANRHIRVQHLKMVEASVTPDPAFTNGRATLAPLSFSAAMSLYASKFSKSTEGSSMTDQDKDKKEPTEDELKATLVKLGYKVEKLDPLAEAKAALEAKNKEIEAVKAEIEKMKAAQQAAPPPPSAPGKPASPAAPINADQKKDEELTLEAQRKQQPQECFVSAFNQMRKQAGYEPIQS